MNFDGSQSGSLVFFIFFWAFRGGNTLGLPRIDSLPCSIPYVGPSNSSVYPLSLHKGGWLQETQSGGTINPRDLTTVEAHPISSCEETPSSLVPQPPRNWALASPPAMARGSLVGSGRYVLEERIAVICAGTQQHLFSALDQVIFPSRHCVSLLP